MKDVRKKTWQTNGSSWNENNIQSEKFTALQHIRRNITNMISFDD